MSPGQVSTFVQPKVRLSRVAPVLARVEQHGEPELADDGQVLPEVHVGDVDEDGAE